ncbi:hypothetical protein P8452_70121 [Trifolium repens]|nr:hypothetical protein P8452_70121 [Trifolium repens]
MRHGRMKCNIFTLVKPPFLKMDALGEAANHSGWDCTINRTESELVEEIAMDVLQKLNRVYVGDLDDQINKLEQLAQLQLQYYKSIDTYANKLSHEATVERVTELKIDGGVIYYY